MKNAEVFVLTLLALAAFGCQSDKQTTTQTLASSESDTTTTAPGTVIDSTTANGPVSQSTPTTTANTPAIETVGLNPSAPSPSAPSPSLASGDAAAGHALFQAKCTGCHGSDGSGRTTMGAQQHIPDFSSAAVQTLSDAQLADIIHNGTGGVSAMAHKSKGLNDSEAKNVIAWIRTLKK